MKRFLMGLTATLMLAVPAFADEGMWILPLLEKMNGDMIYKLGGHLSADEIYSVNHSSIKDAVVQFGGGCTGEIISDSGLLVTNHHCGYSSIQSLSTPEKNYLEDGFWAMSLKEEIPVPRLTVRFLQSMTDITRDIEKLDKKTDAEKEAAMEEIVNKAKAENPNCTAQITSFYNSNVYYLIVSKIYRDVRFVGAPPRPAGKFGGDTDNWMWPRHTCDFSMFRVYAGPDNEPAEYSENNVPMKPKQSLKISLKGYEEGDFAMIMGYPGRTQRFQTAAQLKQMLDINDISIAARTVRQDVMWEARMADPAVNLQYASKYAGSSNGWKKWQGMKEAFAKLDVIGREEQKESDFMEWVNASGRRKKAYGSALDDIRVATESRDAAYKAYNLIVESIYKIEAVSFGGTISSATRFGDRIGEALNVVKESVKSQYKDYFEPLDRKEAVALINFYRENVNPEDVIKVPGYDFLTMDVNAYVDNLFTKTHVTSEKGLEGIKGAGDINSDPAVILYEAIYKKAMELSTKMNESSETVSAANKAYTAGLLEWKKDDKSYPDANSTCRLTFGNIKSYSPKDGVLYKHYTTLKGVMEKEDPDNYEFIVPARLKEIYKTKDYGQYANKDGEMPVCFLTNLDITGGNSGSPVMDADGNLIGLAFDGNWEAMSGDVIFEPELQRCICVDIRYVLLMVDKFGGAGYLLDEMNIVK